MAGMRISVNHDIEAAAAHFEALSQGLKNKATVRALNRVADMAKTAASKEIRQTYRIKARDLSAMLKVRKASVRAIYLEAAVSASGRASIPIVGFAARQTKKGVTVSVTRGGGRKLLPGAFIATMKNGKVGVWDRQGKKRLPIKELFTIGVPYQFAARKTVEAMARIVRDKFPERLQHELDRELARFAR